MVDPEEALYNTLQEQFYLNVPFPLAKKEIEEVMTAFFRFLELPDDIKNHIDYKISTLHRRGDVGFKHRKEEDGIYDDNKDFFHFHPTILSRYADFIKENPIVNDFVSKALPIWNLSYTIIKQILSIFEKKYPGTLNRVMGGENCHILLRFLKYEWSKSNKYLAKPHFDAGSFTLAIAESDPGLRIGSNPENLTPVTHKQGKAIFMLSSNFKKIIDTDKLQAAWHDVIQVKEELIGKPYARWALVAFIDANDVEALSRSETHKYYKE